MPTITNRHPGRCKSCGKSIPVGERVSWTKGRGIRHLVCPGNQENQSPNPEPEIGDPSYRQTFSWHELREDYRKLAQGDNSMFSSYGRKGWGTEFISQRKRSGGWYGATVSEMLNWLDRGYKVDLFPIDDLIPERKRRRLKFSDEGELQLDLAWSGHDYPFLTWEQREKKAGMSIDIRYNFSASVNERVVKEYAHFIAQVTETLETSGYDLEINIVSAGENLGASKRGNFETAITVKRENEATDMADWSALFSPGGFRHLVFLALAKTCERWKSEIQPGLGTPPPNPWKVEFDPETRRMTIFANSRESGSFPAESMNAQFKAALELARK